MKTKIYYFTGTGNSLFIAKEIASKLENAEILPIPKALNEESDISGDKIGIIAPVYMYRFPHAVIRFAQKIKSAAYVFAVANNAGAPGKSLRQLDGI